MKILLIFLIFMIPLFASSLAQEETTEATSKISEDENILDKGIEGAKEVIEKGKEVGQTVIESETERRQEIDQKRLV